MRKQWNTCWYCGVPLHKQNRSHDHVVAASRGGDKFVEACKRCNVLKGQSSVDEYREFLTVDEPHVFFGETQGWEPW